MALDLQNSPCEFHNSRVHEHGESIAGTLTAAAAQIILALDIDDPLAV